MLVRRVGSRIRAAKKSGASGALPVSFTPWQEAFCRWNAERLGIGLEQSRARYLRSWSTIPSGHAGPEFREFGALQEELYRVVAEDDEAEVHAAYRLHAWMHFLRQLSYPVPTWLAAHAVLAGIAAKPAATIVDFGCGLAQTSISLALALHARGCAARLYLADIPTIRADFLAWFCRDQALPFEIAECTRDRPIPDFPACDAIVATEVFEHLHDPLSCLERMHDALCDGGFLATNVCDREAEFMHVTPALGALRQRLRAWRYRELEPNRLLQKPPAG